MAANVQGGEVSSASILMGGWVVQSIDSESNLYRGTLPGVRGTSASLPVLVPPLVGGGLLVLPFQSSHLQPTRGAVQKSSS
jgi:hypothetical protein